MTFARFARLLALPFLTIALTGLAAGTADARESRLIKIEDRCDPATFNAALEDPNACVGDGNVTFQEFIARLTRKQTVGKWRFEPDKTGVKADETVVARNDGGELHTFTKVVNFGGGFVPILNQLSGNPVPTPECAQVIQVTPGVFVPAAVILSGVRPGGNFGPGAALSIGPNLFQCCIHPWMRTTITVESR